MNDHGVPTLNNISKIYCRICANRLRKQDYMVCMTCQGEHLELQRVQLEDVHAFWDRVGVARAERRLKNTFIERAGYAAQ